MSNSIWKKYGIKDIPDENKLVVLIDKHDGFYNACFVDKTDWVNDWYNHIEKWCYLDNLIAQADKAERLQKAVDLAVDTLKKAETTRELTVKGHYVHAISLDELHSALVEIKQLIKGEQ